MIKNIYIKGTDKNTPTAKIYQHFRQRGHSSSDMGFIAIKLVRGRFEGDEDTLAARELVWINRLQTIDGGLITYRTGPKPINPIC